MRTDLGALRAGRWLMAALALAVVALRIANLRGSHEVPWLLTTGNSLFMGVVSCFVVVTLVRVFLRHPMPNLLLICSGVTLWGASGSVSLNAGGRDFQVIITLHNLLTWLAALAHWVGTTVESNREMKRPLPWLALMGVATAALIWITVVAATAGWTPVFFIQHEGGTSVRMVVMASSVLLYAGTAAKLQWWGKAMSTRSFADWYALGMAFTAVSIAGSMLQTEHGSVLSWTSRGTAWLGGICLFIAARFAGKNCTVRADELFHGTNAVGTRWTLGIVFVAAAVVLRLAFLNALGTREVMITFFPAVILSSLYGGRAAGWLATLLSVIAVNWFWEMPFGHWTWWQGSDWLIIGLFVASAGMVVTLVPAVQKARARDAERAAIAAALRESERVRAELVAAKERTEAASRAKDDFLAALSHELRTPLTPVLMAASHLRDDPRLPADMRADLAMIERNVGLESRLIDDLLDLTRVAHGKLVLRAERTDVHVLLSLAVEIVRDLAREKQIEIKLDLKAPRSSLIGDPARLQQVFWNLLTNAVKFTPRGGHVCVRSAACKEQPDCICVEVQDDGAGFPPEASARIFEKFEQMQEGRRWEGLGLGLAIARAVVEMHRGKIEGRSEGPGKGATFEVQLPLAPAGTGPLPPDDGTAQARPRIAETHDDASPLPMHLLLVEDDATSRDVLSRLLAKDGHSVKAVGTVADALAAARGERFDGLISDLGLPDGTGIDLISALKEEQGLRGVALSGYGSEADVRRSLEAGFVTHLVKPVDFRDLERALKLVAKGDTVTIRIKE